MCLELGIPFKAAKVKVEKNRHGLEAAAREARRAAFRSIRADAIALAHHLDDQAETVLFNLLRGAGLEGASGMPAVGALGGRSRRGRCSEFRAMRFAPMPATTGSAPIEDESNADESLTRNFIRRRVGPLLETRFRAGARTSRAARHFADGARWAPPVARVPAGAPACAERIQAGRDAEAALEERRDRARWRGVPPLQESLFSNETAAPVFKPRP
jgi:tRNA(Ile)-lysidine synthase